jgi:hypothetical protein
MASAESFRETIVSVDGLERQYRKRHDQQERREKSMQDKKHIEGEI